MRVKLVHRIMVAVANIFPPLFRRSYDNNEVLGISFASPSIFLLTFTTFVATLPLL